MRTKYHVGIVKPLLLELILTEGAQVALVGWTGTDDEAWAAIQNDPRDVFVLNESCDNRADDGRCLGHEEK